LTGAVSVPQTTSQVVLNISNSAGVLVQSINLGAQAGGARQFLVERQTVDGSQAPAGTYTLSAQVAGVSGGTASPRWSTAPSTASRWARAPRIDIEHRGSRQRALQQRSADFQLIHSGAHMATFSIALSGLDRRQFRLDITSNNIANADTSASRARRPNSPTCTRRAR
jgi:hypothetical protein